LNVFQFFNYIVSDLLRITVNLRSRPHPIILGSSNVRPRISMYFDIGLACIFLAVTIVGHVTKTHSHNYYSYRNHELWVPGVVLAYFVV
jgi:hypothetical protein